MEKPPPSLWSDGEILALIEIWGEEDLQRALRGSVHNGYVYAEISERMQDLGFSKTSEQCRWKVKSLRNNFRQCYDKKTCAQPQWRPIFCWIRYANTASPFLGAGRKSTTDSTPSWNKSWDGRRCLWTSTTKETNRQIRTQVRVHAPAGEGARVCFLYLLPPHQSSQTARTLPGRSRRRSPWSRCGRRTACSTA